MDPKELKNSDVGKPIIMTVVEAEETLRDFIGGMSGTNLTVLAGWLRLEAVRTLADAAKAKGKG
jgi:hypothetical protein